MVYCCLITGNAIAQNSDPNAKGIEFDIKKTLPTSPEAAMLGKFGDIPIGYYTGTANVSIPLYTVKAGDISIPITLSYHNSGVKVEDEATWVGLGWSLEPAGAIIKIINGKDDAGDNLPTIDPTGFNYLFGRSVSGVYSQVSDVGYATWLCDGQGAVPVGSNYDSPYILNSIAGGYGQPDMYQFSFPGGASGKFYISPKTQLPVLIDKKDSLVIRPYTGNGSGWSIKTLNGDQYIFTYQETAYVSDFTEYSGRTWKLTQILLNNGKSVDFKYLTGGTSGINYYETYHDPYPYQPIVASDYGVVPHTTFPESTTWILSQIMTDNETINFNTEDRLDIAPGGNPGGNPYSPKRLKTIDILNATTAQVVKSFNFGYDYFTSSTDTAFTFYKNSASATLPSTLTSRLKLNSVTEVGYTATGQAVQKPPYTFGYNSAVPLPSKVSLSRDFWGYYNGAPNRLLLPNLYYFYYSDFDSYKGVPASTLNAFKGANRTVDVDKLMAGLLTSITYPTGGYTNFGYQPNDFSNYSYPDIASVNSNTASVNVTDQNNSNNQKSSSFTLSTDQTVQFSNYIQSGPPNTAITFDGLLASTITLSSTINGITTIVKQWQMSTDQRQQFANNGNVMTWINDPVTLKANVLYTIAVELPDALGPQNMAMLQASVSSIFKYFAPATNVPKITFGGGVRVSEISNYDNTGVLTDKKILKYINADGTSSGKLMSHLQFLYSRNLLCTEEIGSPNVGDGHFTFLGTLQNIYFISSQSAIPYSTSAGGNLVGYSRVEEINVGTDGSTNGKHVIYYHNNPDQTKINCPNIPDLSNGLISEEDFLNENGDVLKTVSNLYSDQDLIINPLGNTYKGVKVQNNFIGPDPCYRFDIPVNGSYNYTPDLMPTKYEIDFYPINSAWNLLNSKTTKDFNGGNPIVTTEAYTYNKLGQLVVSNTVNSRGENLTTTNLYPDDVPVGSNPIVQSLIDSSFYDNILEQHHLNNNVETSSAKIRYGFIDNQLVQGEIDRSYNSKPIYTDITFDRYGPNKTIRQFTQKGTPIVLIWSYNNTYPVAEIRSTTYAYVEAAIGASVINSFGLESPTKARVDSFIAQFRAFSPNVQITTYSYNPMVGLLSTTNPTGISTYYEYDSFLRLLDIKDTNGDIVKTYDYHYKP